LSNSPDDPLLRAAWQMRRGRGCQGCFAASMGGLSPRPFMRAIEMMTDDLDLCRSVEAEARYPKELEEPYADAEKVLRALSLRCRIGVIANQSAGAEARLTRWGLMPFISICLSSAEVGIEKPDPAIFRLALAQARCEPCHTVMIGDRIDNDIRPARLLGWKTIRVMQGFARFQCPRDGLDEADAAMAKLAELLSLFPTGAMARGCAESERAIEI
jgi:HAD superfamily hydrolase (TIGR01549 family)